MKKNKRIKKVVICVSLIMLLLTCSIIGIIKHKAETNVELSTKLENGKSNNTLTKVEVEMGKAIGENRDEQITCMKSTGDGGYIVGGTFSSSIIDLGNGVVLFNNTKNSTSTPSDGMIIKYDSIGNVEWGKTVGGSGNDEITCIIEAGGGYVVGGSFTSEIDLGNGVTLSASGTSGMLIKYDSEGNVEWGKAIVGDGINCIAEARGGDYIVGGDNGNIISRYDSSGNMIWEKRSMSESTYINGVVATSDRGCVVVGSYNSSESIDLGNNVVLNSTQNIDGMIIKFDSNGNVEWANTEGGSYDQEIKCIAQARDGGYLVGGYTILSPYTMEDGMIIKYSENGGVQWRKTISGTRREEITCIDIVTSGGFVVGGKTESSNISLDNGEVLNNNGDFDGIIIKYDSYNNVEWGKAVGGNGSDGIMCIESTSGYEKVGKYIVGGYFEGSDIGLGNGVVLNSNGAQDGMIIKLKEVIPPRVTVNPTSGAYAKTRSITITAVDEVKVGLSSSNSYQYYLSTSSTALSGGTWTNYTSGRALTIGEGKTGTYYLFIKRVKDNDEHESVEGGDLTTISNEEYHRFGPYKFDNTAPTAGTLTMKLDSSTGTAYSNNTWTNKSVYIAPVNGSDAQSGHKTTTYSVSGAATLTNQTAGTTLTETGTYTVTVKTTDNVGNTSTSSTYTIKIDKTNPTAGTLTMKLESSSGSEYTNNTWTNKSVYIAPVNGEDELSGHKTTTYSISGATTLTDQATATTLTETGTYTVLLTTTDNAGNTIKSNTYTIRIDKTNPTAGTLIMKLDSNTGATYTNNTWTNKSVYIEPVNGTDEQSGHKTTTYSVSGAITLTSQTKAITLTETGTYTVIVTTEDYVGNIAKNKYTIKIDKTNPTAGTLTMKLESSSGSEYTNNTWTNKSVYIAPVNGEDEQSGHKTTTYSVSGATTLTNQTTATTLTETGTYTITVTTIDNVENTTSSEYTIKIDKTNPTAGTLAMKLESNSGSEYINSTWTNKSVYIEPVNGTDEQSGHKTTTYSVSGATTLTDKTTATTLTETGTYTVTVKTTDNVGNTATGNVYTIKIDKTAPTITVNPTSGTATKSSSVTVTVEDEGGAGLNSNNSYQYYLSTSSTALEGGEWSNYTSGTAFTIGEGKTGTYYLYIKRIEDNVGNIVTTGGTATTIQNEVYQRFGEYIFDNSSPTITFTANGSEEYKKTQSTTVTATDEGAGVKSNSLKYQWNQSETEPEDNTFSSTFTNGGKIEKGEVTGTGWYLWILAEDNLGNKVKVRTNEFYLDNEKPKITKSELINNIVKIEANDKDSNEVERSGVYKYRYITSNTKLENPEITKENSIEVEATGEIRISEINTIKYIYIQVEDRAENVSTIEEVEVPTLNIQGDINIETEDGKGEVKLSWEIGGQGEKIYKVYQKRENENEWTEIQTVEGTELTINTANDIAVPNAPQIQVRGISEDNQINISQTATDNGSTYKFYIEAYDKTETNIKLATSEEIEKEIKTGVKGYYYKIESIGREINESNGTYVEGDEIKIGLENNGKTLKMRAVDVAGNIGEESSVLINIPSKVTIKLDGGTLNGSQETQEKEGLVGQTVDIGTPEKEGYTFIGWEATVGTVEGTQYTYAKEEGEVTAKWQINEYNYQIEYYYEGTKNDEETITQKANYGSIIREYEEKQKEGYKLQKTENLPLTIATKENENIIKIYYIADEEQTKELRYIVEYYKNGEKVEEDTQQESITVQILQPNTIAVDKTKINIENKYIAYDFDKEQTGEIPEKVETGTIIKIYYIKNENKTGYKIEYYYNNECDPTKTETIETVRGETITKEDIEEKIEQNTKEGYRIFTVLNVPLKVEENIENIEKNIIKVYYVTKETVDPENPDEEVEKKTGYTIEYYYDNKIDNTKTEIIDARLGETITKETINEKAEQNTKEGYKITTIINAPLEISASADNNIIKVYYTNNEENIVNPENPDEVDPDKEIKTTYTIEYYYDNQKDNKKTELEIVTLGTKITKEIINDKVQQNTKEGYELTTIVNIPLETKEDINNNVIKVYYTNNEENIVDPENPDEVDPNKEIKTTYTIEYYYDNKKDNTKTELEVVTLGTEITKETIKDKVQQNTKEGYKLTIIQNIPLEAKEDINNNVIKVYYTNNEENIVDPENPDEVDQSKEIKTTYTIEYYYDNKKDNTKTELEIVTLGTKITKETINDRVQQNIKEGYKLTIIQNIPLEAKEDINNNVIKVYYTNSEENIVNPENPDEVDPDKEIKTTYTIEYYYDNKKDNTKTELEVVTLGTKITKETINDKVQQNTKEGYKLTTIVNIPLETKEDINNNVIKVYYTNSEENIIDSENPDEVDPSKEIKTTYTIEYYYDNKRDNTKTELEAVTLGTKITKETINDKVQQNTKEGYKLTTILNIPLETKEDKENNTIKIYYKTETEEPENPNEEVVEYIIEYYYNGTRNNALTEIKETKINSVITEETIQEQVEKNKTEDYVSVTALNTPLTVNKDMENNIIKVYYVVTPKETDHKKYKIEYYYDNKKDENKTEEITDIKGNVITEKTIEEKIRNNTEEGYKLLRTENTPLVIEENEENNTIKVYYTKRTDLSYKVEYYYEGEKDENKTEIIGDQAYKAEINTYAEKGKEGYILEKTENLPLIIETEEENNIIKIYYIKRSDLTYTVNYLEKGTNNEIKEEKVVGNQTYESIITTEKEIVEIDGYNYNSIDKEELTITTNTNEINIYYTKRNDLKYTVNYLEKNTDKILSQPKVETNQEFKTEIIASDEIITIEGYKYDSADKESITIQVDEAQNAITIYYTKRNDLTYTVNYLEKGTDNKIKETKIVENQIFESTIITVGEIIEIDGYNYDSCDKEQIIITTVEENNVINLYYTKRNDLKYTINYLEEDTGEILHTQKEENDQEFEKVVTAESEIIEIEGYEYSSCDKEKITIGTDETQNIINIYYIKRSDLKYVVNYLEEGTDKVIKEQKTAEGQVFEGIIEASTEIIKIEGYNYVHSDKENIMIQVDERQNEINLYYTKRTDIKYKVEYYYNGEKDEEETEEYTATYKEIIEEYEDKIRENYVLVEVKGSPLEIQVAEEKNIIKVYYARKTQVIVKYLNKITNEVIEEITEGGYVGKEYTTEAKDFDNYILVEEPEEKTIIMEEEEIIVKYYYKYISKGVIEKHIDVDSGEILYNATYEGNEGDEYKTEPKEFEGYDFVEDQYPENAEGTMEKGTITVNYYYKKKETITITIKYIDKETEEIIEEIIVKDYKGKEYKTEQKEIENYEFIEVVGDTEGILTEDGEVKYYYQKVKQPEPEIPGEGGDDPSTNKPSIDEEQKQPETPDQTTTNKEIPSAGLTKEQIAIIVATVMIIITGVLVVIGIKGIKLDKKH